MATSKSEIQALINLIDDPNDTVYLPVRDRIIEIGSEITPELERAWELEDLGELFRKRVENLLHDIHISLVTKRLEAWRDGGGQDLLEGTLIVSRYRYPDLDERKVKLRLDRIGHSIAINLNEKMDELEQVHAFNHVFFGSYGFTGNKKNYHAPQNNFINEVLDTKKGNPVTLAIIYQLVAGELSLPIFGVNLPNHFVLSYVDNTRALNALFYINAFSKGDILGRNEINEFLAKLKIAPQPSFYVPCTNIDIIRRQLNNVANSYEKNGDQDRFRDASALRDLLGKPDGTY